MCVNGRFVTNRYTGQTFWADCGKCESCIQKRAAARSSRIRNEYDGQSEIYFVTLTYDRLSAPYFLQSELDRIKYELKTYHTVYSPLHIYRRYSIRWNPNKQRYNRNWSEPVLLDTVHLSDLSFKDLNGLKWLDKQPGKIGVIHFPDVQKFVKRLRQNLKYYGYNGKIKVFDCLEYGSETYRPHAHLLIKAPGISQTEFHNVVIKSWTFGRRIRNSKSCELVTDDPAGYVSSYVNCDTVIPSFLTKYFPQKHSVSKYFGHSRKPFALVEIQKAVDRGDLSYDLKRVTNSGEKILHLPIPKYIINRFFPLFKGYSRFASDQVLQFLSSGFDEGTLFRLSLQYDNVCHPRYRIDYTIKDTDVPSDLRRICVRLRNAFDFYQSVFPGSSYFDYAKAFYNTWKVYRSTCYKNFVTDKSVNDFYKYDNICMLDPDIQYRIYHDLGHGCNFIVDNNAKPQRVNETILMTDMYYRYQKQKKVTSLCLNSQGILV